MGFKFEEFCYKTRLVKIKLRNVLKIVSRH